MTSVLGTNIEFVSFNIEEGIMVEKYNGGCFCGAVKIELTGSPALQGFCHCKDCAHWAAAPINAFSLWHPEDLKVTKGESNIGTFNKTENSHRKFCSTCGGHLMTDHPGMGLIDVYANVLIDFMHQPSIHVFYEEGIVKIKDGLPKFKNLPEQAGGSGETVPE